MASPLALQDIVWTLGSVSALHHRPFDAELLQRELPVPPLTTDSLITASRALGFRIKGRPATARELGSLTLPCVALLRAPVFADSIEVRPALVVQASDEQILLFRAGTNQGARLTLTEFEQEFTGTVYHFAPQPDPLKDPDGARQNT